MAETVTIARPYAKALFNLAIEKNLVSDWLKELNQLSLLVQENEVLLALQSPDIDDSDKVSLLFDLLKLDDVYIKNILMLMAENKRLEILPEVYQQFNELALIQNNIKQATLYSAFLLSDDQLSEISVKLQNRFSSKLEIITKIDSDLIGGIKVVVGDQVLDLSVKGQLSSLYTTMTN